MNDNDTESLPSYAPYVGQLATFIVSTQLDSYSFIVSRSDLDNHANMVVVGSEYLVLDDTEKTYSPLIHFLIQLDI